MAAVYAGNIHTYVNDLMSREFENLGKKTKNITQSDKHSPKKNKRKSQKTVRTAEAMDAETKSR